MTRPCRATVPRSQEQDGIVPLAYGWPRKSRTPSRQTSRGRASAKSGPLSAQMHRASACVTPGPVKPGTEINPTDVARTGVSESSGGQRAEGGKSRDQPDHRHCPDSIGRNKLCRPHGHVDECTDASESDQHRRHPNPAKRRKSFAFSTSPEPGKRCLIAAKSGLTQR